MKFNPVTDEYEPEGPWDVPPACTVCGDEMERELCGHCDGTGQVDCYEDDASHVTRRGETRYTCRDTTACLERRTRAVVNEPPPKPWPWWVTIRLRAGWEMTATLDATGEADAISQAEAVVRELLRVDVARDQISAVDVPF